MRNAKTEKRKLSEKQRRFVEFYMGEAKGNATEACRLAGYKGTDNTLGVMAAENLEKPKIKEAIRERQENSPEVMKRKEIQMWLSQAVRDEEMLMSHRLKAVEILARSQGMFLEQPADSLPRPELVKKLAELGWVKMGNGKVS